MTPFTEAELLTVWEAGLAESPVARALTLAAAAGGCGVGELTDLPLGRRDALLLDLRERCFGPRLSSEASCPRCDERLELALDVADVRVPNDGTPQPTRVVRVGDTEVAFRAPTSRDLLALTPGAPDARHDLLLRCIVDPGPDGGPPGDDILEDVAERLGEADPQGDVELALTCASCDAEWEARFDIAGYLWAEVDTYARRLLRDVHCLATAYGWSEAEVLAVSPVRRRFYLDEAPA